MGVTRLHQPPPRGRASRSIHLVGALVTPLAVFHHLLLLLLLLLRPLPTDGAQDPRDHLTSPHQADSASHDQPPVVPNVNLTWTVFGDWHGNNRNARDDDDHYGDLRTIGHMEVTYGRHAAGLRLDTATFFDPPDVRTIDGSGPPYGNNVAIERIHWRYQSEHLTIQLGDNYKVFGRGLALSLRRIDELGTDVSLRGGLVEWKDDLHEITLLGGLTNTVSLEPVEERLIIHRCTDSFADATCNPLRTYPADTLVGLRAARRFPAAGTVGAHMVHMQLGDPDNPNLPMEPRTLGGVSLDIPHLRGVDLYLEANRLLRNHHVPAAAVAKSNNSSGTGTGTADADISATTSAASVASATFANKDGGQDPHSDKGFALYAQMAGTVGPITWLAEGRWYEHYHVTTSKTIDHSRYSTAGRTFAYQEPPSLERPDVFVHNNTDARGIRLRLDSPIGRIPWLAHVNGLVGRAGVRGQTGEATSLTSILHGYGGVEGRIRNMRTSVSGGIRQEATTIGQDRERLVHGEAYASIPLKGNRSLSLQGQHELWQIRQMEESRYIRGTWTLTGSISPSLSTAYVFGYDTEANSKFNRNTRIMEEVARTFHGVQVATRLSQALTAKVFAGSMRGGLHCISGMCRTFPSFSGAKGEVVFRY